MKKQLFLLGTAAILGFAACNDSATDSTTTTDSTANNMSTATTTTGPTRGTEIANFSSRTFMDVKTNKPIKLRWDAERSYYVDESGSQPYYYYDPATKDTFDYWGRRLNSYLIFDNGDWRVDEERFSTGATVTVTDTSTTSTSGTGDLKIKAKDDKYKEKTDSTKLKVTDDKMKVKER